MLGDWLSYADQRVPGLYRDIRTAKVRRIDRATVPGVAGGREKGTSLISTV